MEEHDGKVFWGAARARVHGALETVDGYGASRAMAPMLGVPYQYLDAWREITLTPQLKRDLEFVRTMSKREIQAIVGKIHARTLFKVLQARRENAPDQSGEDIQKAG